MSFLAFVIFSHVILAVRNKYWSTKKHTSLVSVQKPPFLKKVYRQYSYFNNNKMYPNLLLPKIWLTEPISLRCQTPPINNELSCRKWPWKWSMLCYLEWENGKCSHLKKDALFCMWNIRGNVLSGELLEEGILFVHLPLPHPFLNLYSALCICVICSYTKTMGVFFNLKFIRACTALSETNIR